MITYKHPKQTKNRRELHIYVNDKLYARIWTFPKTVYWYGKIEGGKSHLKFTNGKKFINFNEALKVMTQLAEFTR